MGWLSEILQEETSSIVRTLEVRLYDLDFVDGLIFTEKLIVDEPLRKNTLGLRMMCELVFICSYGFFFIL